MSISNASDAKHSRRTFLGMASGAALIAAGSGRAWAAEPAVNAGGAIDVHSHYLPPSLREVTMKALAGFMTGAQGPIRIPDSIKNWSPTWLVEAMDQVGIRTTVSHATWRPPMYDMDAAARKSITRATNEFGAKMKQDHPGRIDFFGFLPMPDVDATLAEIAYCLDELKAPGVTVMSSYGPKWWGHADFMPILEELNRRRAVVFCHPHTGSCCSNLMPGYVPDGILGLMEFPYDTGRAVTGLLMTGALAKYSDIRWIFCHGGGPVPALAGRLRIHVEGEASTPERLATIAPKGVDYELQKLYYETADGASAPTMAALLAYVPPTQVLFGSDSPFMQHADNIRMLQDRKLKPEVWKAITQDNARRLMPGLKA